MRIVTPIAVTAVLCVAMTGLSREASAAGKTRVDIKSKPSGATVWIDDRTSEPAGKTPLTVKLEPGKHTFFVELEGFESASEEVRVTGGRKRVTITLNERKTGTILVLPEGDMPTDDAKVMIDGKEAGSVPDSFDVDEGSHEVEVIRDGYKPFKKTVSVTKGESVEVVVSLVKATADDDIKIDDNNNNNNKPPDNPPGIAAPAPPRISPFSIGASLGIAVRNYDYTDLAAVEDGGTLRPFDGAGLGIAEIEAELRLGGLASARWLRPFSVFGSFSINLPTRSNTDPDPTMPDSGNENLSTLWIRHDAGVRTRFAFGSFWLAVDLAEGGDSLSIDDADAIAAGLDPDDLPNLRYEYLRLGALAGYELGKNSLGVGVDGLLPVSLSGVVKDAFADDDAYGFRAQAWYRRQIIGNIEGMVSGRFLQFFHSFTNGNMRIADGANDRTIEALLHVGYRF